jgi:hydroxyacylglutathione hydrolase
MNLVAIPAFADNYIWMLHNGREALVVDPGEAAPVMRALDARRLTLGGILVTHHHSDHVGGVDELRARLHGPVFGPAHETVPQPCTPLAGGESCTVMGMQFDVIDVPGHTAGHIAFVYRPADAAPILFCGDTLFSAGCGRLFEGTAAQMHASLSQLAALPGDTRVCCGHEYTLSNLRFAAAVEADNQDVQSYTTWCEAQRSQGLPTLPTSMSRERAVNPFLRCHVPGVARAAREHGAANDSGVEVFGALREWKNRFR